MPNSSLRFLLVQLMLTVLLSSSAVFVSAQGKIVLVIDDLGNQRRAGRSVIDSPWVTTVAIMPGRPFTEELAQYAFAQGKEIIIHMPMSNETDFPLGPLGLNRVDGKATLTENLHTALAGVPHAVGLSNHMGSRLTQDREAMGWVMAMLKQEGFYFFDSRTVSTTIAYQVAAQYQLPWSMRNIFLDHYRTEDFIAQQWHLALTKARQGETVTVIGHPYPETLRFLNNLQLDPSDLALLLPLSAVLNYADKAARPLRNFPQGI
ncbi:divergent polysaccharide deacetylase family protein [Reinekea forsetii]|nr:divergent polysaccharide deacetylase family protein [Reinekea forsetii]